MIDKTTVIIVTYNHEEYIESCLSSIDYSYEIIVVDNGSKDRTVNIIEEKFPKVKLIVNKNNCGYGIAVNIGVQQSSGKYVLILNPDTELNPDSIEKLINPLTKRNRIITIPKAVIFGEDKINTCGNVEHFTGLTFTRGLGKDVVEFNKIEILKGLSGVCFALKRELFLEIGGFDEKIFLYMEDAELSWNINSKNLEILFIPDSIIYHHYTFKLPADKIYHVEKGRYIILRKYLNLKHFFIFSPSFLLTEILTWGYAIFMGYDAIKYKFKAISDGFSIQVETVDCDRRHLFNSLDYTIPENQDLINNNLNKIVNLVYLINYTIVMRLWNIKQSNKND